MTGELRTVTFLNKARQRLFGIVHEPERDPRTDVAVVVLSPGIKSRVAPHRLYVKIARNIAAMGFRVLRFDFYGLGDSEGELDARMVSDLYASIQAGRYCDDTIAAMDWFESEYGTRRFVLLGLCGGAITGLFAGSRDNRVDSLVGFGIPVILDGGDATRNQFLTQGELDLYRKGYLRKLFDAKSWIRLITLKSDYRVILKALSAPLRHGVSARKRTGRGVSVQDAGSRNAEGTADNFNPYFAAAFDSYLSSGKKIRLVFGETDRLYWEYEEKFRRGREPDLERYGDRYQLKTIQGARHIFEEREHQRQLFETINQWLVRDYEVGSRGSVA